MSTFAKDFAIVFGGGCDSIDLTDPAKDKPSFKKLAHISAALRSRGWDVAAFFGRQDLLDAFSEASGIKDVKLATQMGLFASLNGAAKNLRSGDQLLLVFDTHGTGPEDGIPHSLCTTDDFTNARELKEFRKEQPGRTESSGEKSRKAAFFQKMLSKGYTTPVNHPEIVAKLAEMKDNGVKIGVMDESCFSGATLTQLGEYGCVLSSTTAVQEAPDNEGVAYSMLFTFASPFRVEQRVSMDELYLAKSFFEAVQSTSSVSADVQMSSFHPDSVTDSFGCLDSPIETIKFERAVSEKCFQLAEKVLRGMLLSSGMALDSVNLFLNQDFVRRNAKTSKCEAYLKYKHAADNCSALLPTTTENVCEQLVL